MFCFRERAREWGREGSVAAESALEAGDSAKGPSEVFWSLQPSQAERGERRERKAAPSAVGAVSLATPQLWVPHRPGTGDRAVDLSVRSAAHSREKEQIAAVYTYIHVSIKLLYADSYVVRHAAAARDSISALLARDAESLQNVASTLFLLFFFFLTMTLRINRRGSVVWGGSHNASTRVASQHAQNGLAAGQHS